MANTYSTTFPNTEDPISEGGNFDKPGSWAKMLSDGTVGCAYPVALSPDSCARCKSATFGADHFSRGTINSALADDLMIMTRIQSATNGSCYVVEQFPASTELQFYRVDDAAGVLTFNTFEQHIPAGKFASGSKMELRSIGSKHYLYVEDCMIRSFSDATYSTGYPGFGASTPDNPPTASQYWSFWECSDEATVDAPEWQGQNSNPTDNNSYSTDPAVPSGSTPSASAGRLFLLVAQSRGTNTHSMSQSGGYTWTKQGQTQSTNITISLHTTVGNGTAFTAMPSVSIGATTCNTVALYYVDPVSSSSTWAVDVAYSGASFAAAATITVTGITTIAARTFVFNIIATVDDNTWSWDGTMGRGWTDPATSGGVQVYIRNLAGSDQSLVIAWQQRRVAGATGNVVRTEATLGNDAGAQFIISMAEVAASTFPPGTLPMMGIGV